MQTAPITAASAKILFNREQPTAGTPANDMHCSPEEVARGAYGGCLSALAVLIVLVACQQQDVLQGALW